MNYHIITQDKFFNQYIEDIYELGLDKENIFWVQGDKYELPYLTTEHYVEYLGKNKLSIIDRLLKISENDKLFVSAYNGIVAESIIESKIKNKLYVYVMGAEFYADPWEMHCRWLYDRKTYKKLQQIGWIPTIKWNRRNPLHWYRIFADIMQIIEWKELAKIKYQKKIKEISRIDYLVLPKQALKEYEFIRVLYPTCHAQHVFGVFDQNFDIANKLSIKLTTKQFRVLLGNSADHTNNHIDGIEYLYSVLGKDIELYSILSYGDVIGRQIAKEYGNKVYGEKYHAVEEFMDRQKYIDFLNGMDIVVMFHNRQQAVGNIITALVLGKPVFMKSKNVVYQMLKESNVESVYDISQLTSTSIMEYVRQANDKRQDTINKIKKIYSKEHRLQYLRNLLV